MQDQKNSRSEQARINGSKSQGPTTPEGLDRCRRVNLTHGSYAAKCSILPHEDATAYAAIFAAATDEFLPANALELDIVANIVDHKWRMSRLLALANLEIQRNMQAIRQNSPAGMTPSELALRAECESSAIERLERRARSHSREMQRLIKLLTDMRKNKTTSVGASQMSNELMDLSAEMLAAKHGPVPLRPLQTAKSQNEPDFEPREVEPDLRQ